MDTLTHSALRVVVVLTLACSLLVQLVMVPLLANDMAGLLPDVAHVRMPLLVLVVLGMVTVQVVAVAVWRLLGMVGRGAAVSRAGVRHLDAIVAAIGVAALLFLALAVTLAPGPVVAPGIVLLVCMLSGGVGGMALVVLVLRQQIAAALVHEA